MLYVLVTQGGYSCIWMDHTEDPFLLLLPFISDVCVTFRTTNKAQGQRTCHQVTFPNL